MLRDGKSTPAFVDSALSVFGNNPFGNPNYRLIWSERKMIHFGGEMCPEYIYLDPPGWIIEAWVPAEVDAGTPEQWERTTYGLMGPYPSQGTYNLAKQFPEDWEPTEELVRLYCVGLAKSKNIDIKERVRGIRENKEREADEARQKVADEIVELQDSASRGLIQQAVSGPKNNFRTTDDYERDLGRAKSVEMPKSGGAIY